MDRFPYATKRAVLNEVFKTIDWRITHFGVRLILSPTVNVIHYTVATAQPAPQHSL